MSRDLDPETKLASRRSPVVVAANRIVVIGASAGGVSALRSLLARFDADWPVSVFITLHTGRNRSLLPNLLSCLSPLPAVFAEHQGTFGRAVYIAPPDRHLIIGRANTFLSAGPKENHTRPAIDPMFRSAAHHHGRKVIGLLLTGHLYDGMNGLHEIQKYGGTTIVQDPRDAEVPEIPLNALSRVQPDYVLPLADIPEAIAREVKHQRRSTEARSGP